MPLDIAESKLAETKIISGDEDFKTSEDLENDINHKRRNLKWLTFSKPKIVSGFDHLKASELPLMAAKPRGISLTLEKILGWIIPFSQFKNLNPIDEDLTVQLSFSLFHFNSKSFFGSTWMGAPVSLSDGQDILPVVIDVEYNEVLYLISRLTDPSCVGIIEIVVSRVNKIKNIVSAQYGCGWTIVKLFEQGAMDISDGVENNPTMRTPFFDGSPRELIMYTDLDTMIQSMKQISNCVLEYRLFSNKKLLRANRLIAENEIIGRFDVIGGLLPKSVTLPGMTQTISLPCIGDEEYVDGRNGVYIIPSKPDVAQPFMLNLVDCLIASENRSEMERRMALHIANNIGQEANLGVQIVSRHLQIGLHNGHTLLGGEFITVNLIEDRDDPNLLVPVTNLIELDGYIPHEVTAVVIVLEYVFRSISNQFVSVPTMSKVTSTLNTTLQNGQLLTTITVGATAYVPYDGSKLVLHNHRGHGSDSYDSSDLAIQLDFRVDDICSLVSIKPVYMDIPDDIDIHSSQVLTKKSAPIPEPILTADDKGSDMKRVDRDTSKLRQRAVSILTRVVDLEQEEKQYSTPYTIAFDLRVIDVLRGTELNHGQSIDVYAPAAVTRLLGTTMMSPSYEDRETMALTRNQTHMSEDFKQMSGTISPRSMKRFKTSQFDTRYDENNEYAHTGRMSEPLVEGDELLNSLRLDRSYYEEVTKTPKAKTLKRDPDSDSDMSGMSSDSRFRLPLKMKGLLGQAMKVKLASDYRHSGVNDNEMLYERPPAVRDIHTTRGGGGSRQPHYAEPKISYTTSISASYPTSSSSSSSSSSAAPYIPHSRELSRAARARLGRHGIDHAMYDPAYQIKKLQPGVNETNVLLANTYTEKLTEIFSHKHKDTLLENNIPGLINAEINEMLPLHEITIQFAGYVSMLTKLYKAKSLDTKGQESLNTMANIAQVNMKPPKSVYFTYQFYSCKPTRTEIMRLLPADQHQAHILVRDISHSRDEVPLALRYTIDCDHPNNISSNNTQMNTYSLLPDPLYEAREFAEYLAKSCLYIEVWDAESLLLLGSCGVPLQKIMTQGKEFHKISLECDIIDANINDSISSTSDGILTTTIQRGQPIDGSVIGAVQMIVHHSKKKSPYPSKNITVSHTQNKSAENNPMKYRESLSSSIAREHSKPSDAYLSSYGLNWRAHDSNAHVRGTKVLTDRPRTRVRAVPLTESTPELTKVLNEHHQNNIDLYRNHETTPQALATKSLSAIRGDHSNHTLSYDDIMMLFKRFQGGMKGTIQYKGNLLSLLDIPTWSNTIKKILDLHSRMEKGKIGSFEKELRQYADNIGKITASNLSECFKSLFDHFGITVKIGEIAMIITKFENSDNHVDDIVRFCRSESDRILWQSAGKKLRIMTQKAIIMGDDIEQLLSDQDTSGDGYITAYIFRDILKTFSKYGKLTMSDMSSIVRHFTRVHMDAPSSMNGPCISLREICAFLGVKYIGNIPSLIRKALQGDTKDTPDLQVLTTKLIRFLTEHSRVKDISILLLDDIEATIASFGAYNYFTHDQFRAAIKRANILKGNKIALRSFLKYINIPLLDNLPLDKQDKHIIQTLLKIFKTKVRQDFDAFDKALRSIDLTGEGFLLPSEYATLCSLLHYYDEQHIFEAHLLRIIQTFPSSDNSGTVSITKLYEYLDRKSGYSSNAIQNISKRLYEKSFTDKSFHLKDLFVLSKPATQSGVPVTDNIGTNIDSISDNTTIVATDSSVVNAPTTSNKSKEYPIIPLKITDLFKYLQASTILSDIDITDCQTLFTLLDHDHDGTILSTDFIIYFETVFNYIYQRQLHINQYHLERRFRHLLHIALQNQGMNAIDLFYYFSKDKSTSISYDIFKIQLKKLSVFKEISDIELNDLVAYIDVNHSGLITKDEFITFVESNQIYDNTNTNANMSARNSGRDDYNKENRHDNDDDDDRHESKSNKERVSGKTKSTGGGTNYTSFSNSEILIQQFQRISKPDGGLENFFAYLDEDGDGVVSLNQIIRLCRRENVFDFIDQYDVVTLLQQHGKIDKHTTMTNNRHLSNKREESKYENTLYREESKNNNHNHNHHNNGDEDEISGDQLSVIKLLHYFKGIPIQSTINSIDGDLSSIPQIDNNLFHVSENQLPTYEFSTDPEIHALEKKIRNIGHFLAKKGIDVEALFKVYDTNDSGCIRRTDLINILSNVGLYILEKGQLFNHNNTIDSSDNNSSGGNMNQDLKRQQLLQIKRLKQDSTLMSQFHASRMAKKLVLLSEQDYDPTGQHHSEFTEHMESMALINWYRQSQKKLLLQRILSHSLSTTISLFPRFGKMLFFEYPLTNPYGYEERFIIDIPLNETELKVITSYNQWVHCRKYTRVCVGEIGDTPIEVDMFDYMDRRYVGGGGGTGRGGSLPGHGTEGGIHITSNTTGSGGSQLQVTLLPHETIYIPFSYLSLSPYVPNMTKNKDMHHPEDTKSNLFEYNNSHDNAQYLLSIPQKLITVKIISASHGHIISVLNMNIFPRPFVTHRIIRYYDTENTISKRRIKAIGYDTSASLFPEDSSASAKYIHCVEYYNSNQTNTTTTTTNNNTSNSGGGSSTSTYGRNNVVVEWRESTHTITEFLLRYRCSLFPHNINFFILLYDDPYQCQLREIWSFVVESRQRLDLQGCVGNTVSVDLVVKGDTFPRRSKCYASLTSDIPMFQPNNTFQIIPGAYNRITFSNILRIVGTKRSLINVVDTDSRELISSWLVTTNVTAPEVLRTYDVNVSIKDSLYKKIVFKNPWNVPRRFLIHSSHESIMQSRSPYMDVAANGSAYIRLTFNPNLGSLQTQDIRHTHNGVGTYDVYLFLNDESGQNEECFLFKVNLLL